MLQQDLAECSQSVIKHEGTGRRPVLDVPAVYITYLGRDLLSPEARASIRDAWRTTRQLRGDAENHWAMYYTSLYLMSELYPTTTRSGIRASPSEENRAEAKAYLIKWMNLTTTI